MITKALDLFLAAVAFSGFLIGAPAYAGDGS